MGNAAGVSEAWKPGSPPSFHDIVNGLLRHGEPERALGQYQESGRRSNPATRLRALAAEVDTFLGEQATHRGHIRGRAWAGASRNLVSQTGRHAGRRRLFHVYNPTPKDRDDVAELTLWDYDLPAERITVRDQDGKPLPFQVLDQGYHAYWGHHYATVLVRVSVPAMGRTLVILDQTPALSLDPGPRQDPRTEPVDPGAGNNTCGRAGGRGRLISLYDKRRAETLGAGGLPLRPGRPRPGHRPGDGRFMEERTSTPGR